MRRIKLGTFSHDFAEKSHLFALKQWAEQPLDPRSGMAVEELRRSVRLLDRLERAATDYVDLEDADWLYLKQKISSGLRLIKADREVLALIDEVENAKEV